MALLSPALFDQKPNYVRTREQRAIEALRHAQKGGVLDIATINDLLAMLTAMDDYANGTTTTMDTMKANYATWMNAPKNK
jgi:hypothetical protein